MTFKQYTHVERFGNTEVEGIELGIVHVFPKLDGTNASLWNYADSMQALNLGMGSRTRIVTLENDNQGFAQWATSQKAAGCHSFLQEHPHLRLYGEWLVPHTFKGYRPEAWRNFYVFDVYSDAIEQYLSYDVYKPLLDEHGVEYLAPLSIVKNGDYERFLKYVNENFFLCPDGAAEPGEGVVLKNYDYQNQFGRQAFAKIIRQEFKELHHKVMGAPEINTGLMNEERIVNKYVTKHLVDKTYGKILDEYQNWSSKYIPRLLDTVYYDLVREELWDALKEIQHGSINFKTLKALTIRQVKQLLPEVF